MSSVGLESFGFHVAVGIFLRQKEMRCGLLMELQSVAGFEDKEIFLFQKGFAVFRSRATITFFLVIICCNSSHTHT